MLSWLRWLQNHIMTLNSFVIYLYFNNYSQVVFKRVWVTLLSASVGYYHHSCVFHRWTLIQLTYLMVCCFSSKTKNSQGDESPRHSLSICHSSGPFTFNFLRLCDVSVSCRRYSSEALQIRKQVEVRVVLDSFIRASWVSLKT